ncbi:ATP-binding cassette domain-containing protein, partial [Bacteroides salyersiae]|uniref:ATP-binding cassette domain-containing protein n=1 Tax=Bacteroides salyersiae TaxID=291644 RepID=UPI00125E01FA
RELADMSLVQPSFRIEKITFSDVTFGYETGRQTLSHANFVFERGKMTALVGATGCGKTTVMRLLLGLVSPQQGTVTVSDNKSGFPMAPAFRQRIAYVPQGNYLFSGSIRENLSLGNPDADDEVMKKALKMAAADFVFSMPSGLNSELKEGGKGLSGGQIQRLAIARALLHGGDVLLLDEATASLDEETEQNIIHSLKAHGKDKMIIVVSHRKQVIDVCDKKYVLNFL